MKEFFLAIKQEYLSYRVAVNIVILATLCLCSMVTQFMNIALLVVVAIIFVLTPFKEEIFYYLMFLAPFASSLRLFDLELVYITLLAFGNVCLFIKLVFEKKVRINWFILISFILLFVYMFMPIGEYNFKRFGYIGLIAVIILSSYNIYSYRDKLSVSKLAKFGLFGLIYASLLTIFLSYFPEINKFIILTYSGEFKRFNALFTNPNHLSEFCVVLISLFASVIICDNHKRKNILFFIISLIIGYLSYSKSFMLLCGLVLFILLVYSIIFCYKNANYKKHLLWVLPIFVVIIAVTGYVFLQRSGILSGEFNLDSITTDRVDIWINALKEVAKSPISLIFGLGMASELITSGGYLSTHNIYIEFFQRLGIVGTLILLVIILYCFVTALKKNKVHFSSFIPLFIVMCYGLAESLILNMCMIYLIPISIGICFIDCNKKLRVKNE